MHTRTRYGRSAEHKMEVKNEIEVNGTIEQMKCENVKTYLVPILNDTTNGSQCQSTSQHRRVCLNRQQNQLTYIKDSLDRK